MSDSIEIYSGGTSEPQQNPAPAAGPVAPRQRGYSYVLGIVAALVVGAVAGGGAGAGVAFWATSNNKVSEVTSSKPTTITVNDADDATSITAAAAQASPSVVTVSVSTDDAGGTGSGVILNKDGYIVTNAHVVTLDGATTNPTIGVQTDDGRLFEASVVGVDPIYDLAVIKVDDVTDLKPASFADSSKLNVGDTTIAIGAPLGLANTVTNGIVSALNRSITIESSAVPEPEESSPEGDDPDSTDPDEGGPFDFWNFDLGEKLGQSRSSATSSISLSVLQTDAAINPGNSGGALLNSDGEVIGVNVAIASAESGAQAGSIGLGFAIPSAIVERVTDELIKNGTASHGLLGASVADVTEDSAQKETSVVGASVMEVVSGSAAESAGLRVGDVITAINDLPVSGKVDLTAQVRALPAGAKATISYLRDGKAADADVTLGALK